MAQTHPSFFTDAAYHLAAWKTAEEKLAALEGPYNELVFKIGEAQRNRVAATAATGVLADLENITGPAAALKTMEAARVQLTNDLHYAMRSLNGVVTEYSSPATSNYR